MKIMTMLGKLKTKQGCGSPMPRMKKEPNSIS